MAIPAAVITSRSPAFQFFSLSFSVLDISVSQPYSLTVIGSTNYKLFTVTTGYEAPFYPVLF
jgi:hypothetical protein